MFTLFIEIAIRMKPPGSVQFIVFLFLIIIWCDLFAAMVCVIPVCLHAYVCFHLPAIDSNDNECTEEGEVFDYQGED
jgi:hypothetical protein